MPQPIPSGANVDHGTLPSWLAAGAPTRRGQPVAAVFFARVPVVVMRATHVRDARARSLLALVDGRRSVDAILEESSMPTEEGLAILEGLRERGVIALR
jgi:hypothetical protein